ncbi:MAG: mercuric reductase, partial [Burkholderiales bacterium]
MTVRYDAIVIGTGQSGPSLAVRLAKAGMKTAIVERKLFGGTCVNTGCIPTKTLVASARVAHMARRGVEFGVILDTAVQVDMRLVKARKDAVVRQSNEGVAKWLRGTADLTVYQGHARFEGPRVVLVNADLLESARVFINTGGRARVPDIPGLGGIDYLTNSSVMELDYLPRHLIIIGGSYVGLEFAQMYRRFGSQVSVVEMASRLIAQDDEDICATVKQILESEGIEIRLNAACIAVSKRGDEVAAGLNCESGAPEVVGSHLLLAVGRVPNTDDLGLENTGIATDSKGYIVVDDQLRTNVPGVWALGDVNGRGAFTHTSYNDYEI